MRTERVFFDGQHLNGSVELRGQTPLQTETVKEVAANFFPFSHLKENTSRGLRWETRDPRQHHRLQVRMHPATLAMRSMAALVSRFFSLLIAIIHPHALQRYRSLQESRRHTNTKAWVVAEVCRKSPLLFALSCNLTSFFVPDRLALSPFVHPCRSR